MLTKQQLKRRTDATATLDQQCPHLPAERVVDSLSIGLTHIRDLLMARIHEDVEQHYGTDSMLAPVSKVEEERQSQQARLEIDIYSAIVVDEEVTTGRFVERAGDWFLPWLLHLRLGDGHEVLTKERTARYRSPTAEERRLKFLSVLQETVPECTKTPLVLFRLFPRAVRIVAAVAFGDPLRAQELREEQCSFLPAVSDCPKCHGRVLDNEEICRGCGNPVWEFAWLRAD